MAICERCCKEFDIEEAEDYFFTATLLPYDNLSKCLCGECAVEAVESMEDGLYYETCERCGKRFDLFTECLEFGSNFPNPDEAELQDFWTHDILCCNCALDDAFETEGSFHYDEDFEETDDESERISVYDAADIWASNGKDEDYTFGYTEEELEEAFNS